MESLNKVPLLKNEYTIDTWDLYYSFSDGTNFFGGLTITNKRIFFETIIKDGTQKMLAASPLFTNHTLNNVILKKKSIKLIEPSKNSTGNKIILSFNNGEKHILDRKMLAIDKIVDALNIT